MANFCWGIRSGSSQDILTLMGGAQHWGRSTAVCPNPECSHLPSVWLQGAPRFLSSSSQLLSHVGNYRCTRLTAGAPSDAKEEMRKEVKRKAPPGHDSIASSQRLQQIRSVGEQVGAERLGDGWQTPVERQQPVTNLHQANPMLTAGCPDHIFPLPPPPQTRPYPSRKR